MDVLKYANVLGHTVILFFYTVAAALVLKDVRKNRVYVALFVVAFTGILERLTAGVFIQFALESNDFVSVGLFFRATTTALHILALFSLAYALVTDNNG